MNSPGSELLLSSQKEGRRRGKTEMDGWMVGGRDGMGEDNMEVIGPFSLHTPNHPSQTHSHTHTHTHSHTHTHTHTHTLSHTHTHALSQFCLCCMSNWHWHDCLSGFPSLFINPRVLRQWECCDAPILRGNRKPRKSANYSMCIKLSQVARNELG